MNKNQNAISTSWLYVILFLLCLFGAVTLVATLETNKVKREQIRIYNRINNMEQSLRTKDKEIEQYLIKGESDAVKRNAKNLGTTAKRGKLISKHL